MTRAIRPLALMVLTGVCIGAAMGLEHSATFASVAGVALVGYVAVREIADWIAEDNHA